MGDHISTFYVMYFRKVSSEAMNYPGLEYYLGFLGEPLVEQVLYGTAPVLNRFSGGTGFLYLYMYCGLY